MRCGSPGNPALIAVANVNANCTGLPCLDYAAVDGSGGDWKVAISASSSYSSLVDTPFELIVP
jgi:hypothetical protein